MTGVQTCALPILLPCFVSSLVSVVMFYDGLIMVDMISANHKNTIPGEWVVFFLVI